LDTEILEILEIHKQKHKKVYFCFIVIYANLAKMMIGMFSCTLTYYIMQ